MTQNQNPSPALDLRAIVDLEAWQDPRFKDEVQHNPAEAVAKLAKKYGMQIPEGMTFQTVSDEDSVYHLVISNNPAGLAPSDSASEVMGYIQSNAPSPTLGAATEPAAYFSSTTCGWLCNPHICKLGSQGPLCLSSGR